MDKNFLVIFNKDGTPKASYVEGIHYTITEQTKEVKPLVDWIDLKKIMNEGIFLTTEEHNNIFNNNYIYKDGKIVEKPEYVPTSEELQEQARQALDAEYAVKFTDKDNEIIKALVIMQDTEYAQQLRQERTALVQEYADKRSAL